MTNARKTYPLSQSQMGIYAETVQQPDSGIYDQPFLYKISKSVDLKELKEAILKALDNHPSHNCRVIEDEDGVPVQYIDDSAPFEIKIIEVEDINEIKSSLWKPFRFDGSPLMSICLISDKNDKYMFIQWHHIICDGGSSNLFLADVEAALNGRQLQPEQASLFDFVEEEKASRNSANYDADRKWFESHILDPELESELISDLEGTADTFRREDYALSADATVVADFCKANGVKMSNYICSAFALLLSRYTGNEDVMFPTIWHGRKSAKYFNTFGMFVATSPIFYKIGQDDTVADLLANGGELAAGLREHSLYSFADAITEMGIHTSLMFAYQGQLYENNTIGGEPVELEILSDHCSGMPISFQLFNTNGKFVLRAEYMSSIYSESFVSQLADCYDIVLGEMLDMNKKLSAISIASTNVESCLDAFNITDSPLDEDETIISMFKRQVEAHPDKTAVVFKDRNYTYREVDEISDRIAAYIHSLGYGPEDVISILIPRSEWMVLASIGVLKAGCAYQPLDPSYPAERLNFMISDAKVEMLIADKALLPIVSDFKGKVLFTKDIPSLPSAEKLNVAPTPNSLFTLIYTSGSTGVPKGCQLEHRNIVAFCEMNKKVEALSDECRMTAYASFGFDASIFEIFSAMTVGATLYIIPEEIRLDLVALNDYLEANEVTHTFMTTQVAYQFATNFKNKTLRTLLTGGEKLPKLTPPEGYTVINAYGPSETICYVTAFKVKEEHSNVPIGKALSNVKCYIVDKFGHRLPVGACGELWIAGPQVSRGYLNRPEKTAEAFIDNPFTNNPKYCRVYRTGDVVRYLPSGDIEFVGRKDGQVKIRGFRVELKEVESVIRQYPGIKDVTVQAFDEASGGKFIAAYIVSDEIIDIPSLNKFIADEKPPYMVPAATMQIERIPLNQNQKVDKRSLPAPVKTSHADEEPTNVEMNVLEKEIHAIVAKIVGNEDFSVMTPLVYAGLSSIMAIKLAIQIDKRFGVKLDSKELTKNGTIQSIENEILENILNKKEDRVEVEEKKHLEILKYPLSYAQMGVYVECMKFPASTIYNIPTSVSFPVDTDIDTLAKVVADVVKSHPEMSVNFGSEGSEIVQILNPELSVDVKCTEMSDTELESYKREFVKPFNLKQSPLYRFEIVKTESVVCLLMDVHHLIMDGGSMDVMLHQICDLMNGNEIEAEEFSYAEFVTAEKAAEATPSHREAQEFFLSRLGDCDGATEIQPDLTNPSDNGVTREACCELDFDSIQEFCRNHNITPAHLTLAATFYALSRFTNNERLCITTISNGRSDLRIRNTIGMFVNTLALSALIDSQSVMEFINQTSVNFDETLKHENYPFAQISADFDLTAEIMFAYQIGVLDQYVCRGNVLYVENLELDVPKFKVAFYIREHEGKPSVCIEYDNGRYSHELMASLAKSVCNAAKAFIASSEASIQTIGMLDKPEIELLNSFNQTDVDYDDTQTIVSLFRRQVSLTPDNEAIVYHDNRYTYREVDVISERIAAYVASKGLGTEDVVSVLIPRCEWMAIASLGVLKAGCAYQPLDPSYPAERLNFMMKDADAKLLIADASLRDIVNEYEGDVLLIDDIANLPETEPLNVNVKPNDLFILLYTSGSTGVPKGCQLEHRNLVAFCDWYQRYYGLDAECHVAAYASYGFDACMMDLYPALTCGACVYIIGEDIRLNLPDLNNYFNDNNITHSFITTQVGYQFATNVDNHSLRHFAVGGEKLSALNPPSNYKMHNGYGPTECTIFTTNYWVKDYELDIPIGKPLDNLRLYIVDKSFNRLPLGAAGELWVSGPQVSRGYLNRPEKTAEVFIANPFDDDPKHSRIYRTGDIVRYLPDGNIQFVGRRDGQVKIRGFRIELKEVEAVIRQYPGINDATVQAFDYENGGKYIAAYIVSDSQVDIKQLNDFIGQQKPSYMIPAATMQIDSIPLNQNQKVNRKALPAPVIQASDRKYVEPANDIERLFCKIFADILSLDKVGALDNFFDLGGTSLMVTRVIIEADKNSHHIAYGDLFSHPSPRQLSNFLTGAPDTSAASDDADYDYSAINELLERNTLDNFMNGARQSIGNVLLTGSTGYLGIHVLKELIDRDDVEVIYCLVRAADMEKAEHRLKGLLFYYYGTAFKELFGNKLRVVLGDVTQDIVVDGHVDTVFNCAAMVKHFSKTTEIEDVNIGGAEHCIKFCLDNNANLVHVSTYSTAGLSVNGYPGKDAVLTEQKLYYGQFMDNQYVHSKFIAERLVLEAVATKALKAKIARLGNLAPRSTDGEFQINFQTNSAMGRLRVFKMLGCYPYEMADEPMEFSPINEVAHSIVLLSETPVECTLFHPFNNHHVFLGDVLHELGKIGETPKPVESPEFAKALDEAKDDPEKAKRLSSMIAYQDMAHGQQSFDIPTVNSYTSQVLYRMGFRWSTTSWDYVDQFLTAIDGLGYFD